MAHSAAVTGRTRALVIAADKAILRFCRHWLLVMNSLTAILVAGAFLSPLLRAAGQSAAGESLFRAYSPICTQIPTHSFHLFGYQLALCERDLAIYGTTLLAGLAFALVRPGLRRLSLWGAVLLALPMVVDGFTQMFGWRESNMPLRLLTGTLFGIAVVWLVFPYMDAEFRRIRELLERRFARLGIL